MALHVVQLAGYLEGICVYMYLSSRQNHEAAQSAMAKAADTVNAFPKSSPAA